MMRTAEKVERILPPLTWKDSSSEATTPGRSLSSSEKKLRKFILIIFLQAKLRIQKKKYNFTSSIFLYYLLNKIQNTTAFRQRRLPEGLGEGVELLDDLLRLRNLGIGAESGGALRDPAVFETTRFVALENKGREKEKKKSG